MSDVQRSAEVVVDVVVDALVVTRSPGDTLCQSQRLSL